MKRLISMVLVLAGSAGAASVSADQIVNAFIQNETGGPLRATLNMSVLRPGQTTKNVLDIISDGKDRSLVIVKAPAKLAGQAFLRLGSNVQMYNPAFKKVLPLPPGTQGDGFLGSDLSLGDFTNGDYRTNFTAEKVVQTALSASVDLTTKPEAPIPYGKINLSVKLPGLTPQSITYYDQRGQAVKKLSFAAFTRAQGQAGQGKLFPSKFVMDDLLRRGSRTVLEYSNLNFGPVPAACFTPAALEKGC